MTRTKDALGKAVDVDTNESPNKGTFVVVVEDLNAQDDTPPSPPGGA